MQPACGRPTIGSPSDRPRASPAILKSAPDDLRNAVGLALRDARVRAGVSQQELARRSGNRYRPSSIGGYERGERSISVVRFCELARLLRVPADQLLSDALTHASPHAHREVVIDVSDLSDSEAGRETAAHAHRVRSRRGDYLSSVVTLRAGDLQVIADASGLDVPALLSSLGDAVRRIGPS